MLVAAVIGQKNAADQFPIIEGNKRNDDVEWGTLITILKGSHALLTAALTVSFLPAFARAPGLWFWKRKPVRICR